MTTLTRRRLLALLPATPAAAQSFFRKKSVTPVPDPIVYFATDTAKGSSKGIYASRFNARTGQFTPAVLAAETFRPMYLALGQLGQKRFLYATNEGDAHNSAVSTFALDAATGALRKLGEVPTAGAGPCYIAVDATSRYAYIANYTGGTVTGYRVMPDGTLSQPIQSVDFHDRFFGLTGPEKPRQDGPHPHQSMLSPDNRFLVVNDLGKDRIALFPITPESGHLGTPALIEVKPGSGPRHLAFHPNGRWAYGIDELASRIDCYLWNSTHGSAGIEPQAILTDAGRSVPTLDAGYRGVNTAAEIALSPNGDFVYGSNRGENSLVVFRVDPANGSLSLVQRIGTGGKGPRHFTLDPEGNWLICGNQDAGGVTVFHRDGGTGRLTGPVQTLPLDAPVFTLFV